MKRLVFVFLSLLAVSLNAQEQPVEQVVNEVAEAAHEVVSDLLEVDPASLGTTHGTAGGQRLVEYPVGTEPGRVLTEQVVNERVIGEGAAHGRIVELSTQGGEVLRGESGEIAFEQTSPVANGRAESTRVRGSHVVPGHFIEGSRASSIQQTGETTIGNATVETTEYSADGIATSPQGFRSSPSTVGPANASRASSRIAGATSRRVATGRARAGWPFWLWPLMILPLAGWLLWRSLAGVSTADETEVQKEGGNTASARDTKQQQTSGTQSRRSESNVSFGEDERSQQRGAATQSSARTSSTGFAATGDSADNTRQQTTSTSRGSRSTESKRAPEARDKNRQSSDRPSSSRRGEIASDAQATGREQSEESRPRRGSSSKAKRGFTPTTASEARNEEAKSGNETRLGGGVRFSDRSNKTTERQAGCDSSSKGKSPCSAQDGEQELGCSTPARTTSLQNQKQDRSRSSEGEPKPDDFTQLEGVDADTQDALRSAGYRQFADLESADAEMLKRDLADSGFRRGSTADFKGWIQQATDVVMRRAGVSSQKQRTGRPVGFSASGSQWTDDLTRIRGIGSTLAKALRNAGINSFEQLSSAKTSFLQKLVSDADSSSVDASTWPKQAKFAANGDWGGLDRWYCQTRAAAATQSTTVSPGTSNRTTGESDDLTRIEGIGPATQRFLQLQGIVRFEEIAIMSGPELENLFESQENFRLVDPVSWPQEAKEILAEDFDVPVSMLDDVNAIANLRGQESCEFEVEQSR